ncbi:MAG: sulfatase, partial [Limisphaerales bacterium]
MLRILALLLTLAISPTCFGKTEKPNIIFILIDDLGYGDFSCTGNKEVATPNIDRLASEGLRFTQFHVNSPICSPSRVAFTTGQ